MTLSLDEVTALSRAVVAQERRDVRDVEVVGVLSSVGGSGHVELLVKLRECRDDRCRAVLSLTRMDDAGFEGDLRGS
jgi:hypothetical protein